MLEYIVSSGVGRTAEKEDTFRINPRRFSAIFGKTSNVMPVTERMLQCMSLTHMPLASGR